MSVWFVGGAVAPRLAERWSLDATGAGWLTTVVQLGFVAGTATAAVLNLADLFPARRYFGASAILAATANAALLIVPDYRSALAARFLTGFFLAGVYPPGMKMIATWFRRARGLAVGMVIGALTTGQAVPYLVRGTLGTGLNEVVLTTSGAAVLAAVLVLAFYRDGPHRFERRPFSWRLVGAVWGHRETRLAIAGYLGHMWELYAMWTWLPAFVAASFALRSAGSVEAVTVGTFVAGGAGCVWAGWQADRIGRERTVNIAMAASGACCLVVGLAFGADPAPVAVLLWVWGFFIVADSAQFSTIVTEVAPSHAVGTALTLQTSLGFLLTMVTIQAVPLVVQGAGWRWAFPGLALGPVFGIAAIRRLRASRR